MEDKRYEHVEGPLTPADLPYINAVVRKGETVEIRPGPDHTAKIMEVSRKFIKTGREKDCPKCGREQGNERAANL